MSLSLILYSVQVRTKCRSRILSGSAVFLQPLCDLIAEKYGAVASLLLALPTSSGEVEVRSIHSGLSNNPAQENWPEYDYAGYAAAGESLVKFANSVFSE